MKPAFHSLLSAIFLVLLVALALSLDRWISAAAEETILLMNSSWALAKTISRVALAIGLFGSAAFILSRPRPSPLVSFLYLLAGSLLTLLEIPQVQARLPFPGLIGYPVLNPILPVAAAFIAVIGAGALLRPYVFAVTGKAEPDALGNAPSSHA